MNEHVGPKTFQKSPPRPREPERRRFTGDEMEAMLRAGVLHEDERVELIDGEIIVSNAKGARHEIVRSRLTSYWSKHVPDDLMVVAEPVFKLEPYNEPEPDIIVFPDALQVPDVRGNTVLLVVEVSDTSISRDLKIKAPLYARFGVREYWVIDAETHETHIHRDPGADGFASVTINPKDNLLTPPLVPTLAVRLADLRLD